MVSGIDPWIMFADTENVVKEVRLPISLGSVPTNPNGWKDYEASQWLIELAHTYRAKI